MAMNPLLKKEIRLLLPTCVIGLVLTQANWLVPANQDSCFINEGETGVSRVVS